MRALALLALLGLAHAQTRAPLQQYWSAARQDFWVVATPGGIHAASEAFHYKFVRTEAYVLTTAQPGTAPLALYWNEQRQDNRNVLQGTDQTPGYSQKAVEGYVFTAPGPGLVPLKLYDNGRDSFTLATAESENFALAHQYHFVKIEGYAYPADQK